MVPQVVRDWAWPGLVLGQEKVVAASAAAAAAASAAAAAAVAAVALVLALGVVAAARLGRRRPLLVPA